MSNFSTCTLSLFTQEPANCGRNLEKCWVNLAWSCSETEVLFLQGRSPCQHRLLHDFRRRFLLVILSCLRWIFKIRYFEKHINFALLLDEASPPPTYLMLLLSLFSLRGIISSGSRDSSEQTFRDDSLVPRRSPLAHSTRLVATCLDVIGPFGELTKSSEREENTWVLGCRDVIFQSRLQGPVVQFYCSDNEKS